MKAVRGLGNIEILTSYLLIAWSEERVLWNSGLEEMCAVLREDFGEVGMSRHRFDLLQRLNQTFWRFDHWLDPPERFDPDRMPCRREEITGHYGKLQDILLEMIGEAYFRTSYL